MPSPTPPRTANSKVKVKKL